MKLTEEILDALKEATKNRGDQAELSRKTGISGENISRYCSGKYLEIHLENWLRLLPHIKQFLKNPERYSIAETHTPYEIDPLKRMLLEAFESFSQEEKESAVREFIVKSEMKKAKRTG